VKRDIEPEWLIGQSRELLQFGHTTSLSIAAS
jgi:hypothetical protein